MCGLAGIVGNGINNVDLGALYTLSYISGLRGLHSTGICQGNKYYRGDLRYMIEKGTFNVGEFFDYHASHPEGNRNVANDSTDNFFLMHMRQATRGTITPDNAHPFDLDNIVGMHNGTLQEAKYQSEEQTDSELLFADIDTNGIVPVLRDLALGSAYALVMMDKRTGQLNIIRNNKRTLFYCHHRQRNVMYYASEAMFLDFMIRRHSLDVGPIKAFEPEVLYSISPDDVRMGDRTQWVQEPLFQRGALFLPAPKQEDSTHSDQRTTFLTNRTAKAGKPRGRPKGGRAKPIGDDGKVIDIGAAREIVEEIKRERTERLSKSNSKKKRDYTGFEGGPAPAGFEDIAREPWANDAGICLFPRAIPITNCIYCRKRLSLYDKYKATAIGQGMYSCEPCENTQYQNYINGETKVN